MLGLAFDFIFMPHEQGLFIGLVTMAIATVWYAQAQVRWFTFDLEISVSKATAAFVGAFAVATITAFVLALAIGIEANNLSP